MTGGPTPPRVVWEPRSSPSIFGRATPASATNARIAFERKGRLLRLRCCRVDLAMVLWSCCRRGVQQGAEAERFAAEASTTGHANDVHARAVRRRVSCCPLYLQNWRCRQRWTDARCDYQARIASRGRRRSVLGGHRRRQRASNGVLLNFETVAILIMKLARAPTGERRRTDTKAVRSQRATRERHCNRTRGERKQLARPTDRPMATSHRDTVTVDISRNGQASWRCRSRPGGRIADSPFRCVRFLPG